MAICGLGGNKGLILRKPDGRLRSFDSRNGLPDDLVRALQEDRDGNLWVGTNDGLSRLENGKFVAPPLDSERERDWVRSLFEDREGNLWVGMNSGLNRFRDDRFTTYSRTEGLPSDEPRDCSASGPPRTGLGAATMTLAWSPSRVGSFARVHNSRRVGEQRDFCNSAKPATAICWSALEIRPQPHAWRSLLEQPPLVDPLQRGVVYDALEDSPKVASWWRPPAAYMKSRESRSAF